MPTIPTALKQSSWLRPKYLLCAAICLMLTYVIPHDESFLVHPKDPLWHHYEPFKWWLLPHGVAGACALLLGTMQFSDRLRDRFRQLHRVVGRIYVAGAFVAAPLGLYIQCFQERMGVPRSFSIAAAVDAALWMITTGIALVFILKGKVQEHRQWMTRSFAVALVFLEVRVIGGLGGWDNLDAHANETILWTCLAFSILSADLVLQWQQLGPSPSAVRRHSPASPERMLEAPWAMFIGHVSILMASLGGGARASKQKQNKAAQDAVEESFTRLTAHCLPSLFVAFPGAMGKR